MNVVETGLPGLLVLEPRVFHDARGFFLESWNARAFREVTGVEASFVQDNHSRSARGVLRGLHFQVQRPQGKLVRVTQGEVLDVAVDLRRRSPTFGRWAAMPLSAGNMRQLWIPPGFAHGFVVRSEMADVLYKTTDFRFAEHERCIAWNDPWLAIDWQLGDMAPLLSDKDRQGLAFHEAPVFD